MPEKLVDEAHEHHFRVVIYGSARLQEETPEHQRIFRLAKMIGERGFDVVTGGGPGLMEAAMAGHHAGKGDNDSHEIGLQIKLPLEQRDSKHLDVKEEFERFSDRLDTFISLANVVVVAPGGIGTALELFYTWQLVQVKHACKTPIILLGDQWAELIEWVKKWPLKRKLMDEKDLGMIHIVSDCDEAIEVIDEAHAAHLKGGKSACLNIKKYKIKSI
ncbi:MAG: LOG family protein [Candidatus Woesearchaeota archaeon]|nr:LOG family protein [Candidatus Woesearchaeota archaeon]